MLLLIVALLLRLGLLVLMPLLLLRLAFLVLMPLLLGLPLVVAILILALLLLVLAAVLRVVAGAISLLSRAVLAVLVFLIGHGCLLLVRAPKWRAWSQVRRAEKVPPDDARPAERPAARLTSAV
ncbi:MAG TPA: hypothetical protein VNF99_08910 [Stellaceae bacterium]|nr:hypothetical protein [Stellaceae bacterium]